MYWSTTKIEQLVDTPSTLRRATMLAKSSNWKDLSTNYQVIWGTCTVFEQQHYKVRVHLISGHYQCNCLSKKLCKHIIAIVLLHLKSSALFKHQILPDSLHKWKLTPDNTYKNNNRAALNQINNHNKIQQNKLKRWQKRLDLMASGIDTLDIWLSDIVRQGLANVPLEQTSFWDFIASKMMDAKLPAISTYLKETAVLIQHQNDWTELVIKRIGKLYAWISSFNNREKLSVDVQENLYRSLGKIIQKKVVIEQNFVQNDHWLVVGIHQGETIDKQLFRRTWLFGMKSLKMALIEDYSYYKSPFEFQYSLGSVISSNVYYYDKLPQQRALVEHPKQINASALINWKGYANFDQALEAFHHHIIKNPWVNIFPMILDNIAPFLNNQHEIQGKDSENHLIQLHNLSEDSKWQLLAISGGGPICLMGEWDGYKFQPLAILQASNFIMLS